MRGCLGIGIVIDICNIVMGYLVSVWLGDILIVVGKLYLTFNRLRTSYIQIFASGLKPSNFMVSRDWWSINDLLYLLQKMERIYKIINKEKKQIL